MYLYSNCVFYALIYIEQRCIFRLTNSCRWISPFGIIYKFDSRNRRKYANQEHQYKNNKKGKFTQVLHVTFCPFHFHTNVYRCEILFAKFTRFLPASIFTPGLISTTLSFYRVQSQMATIYEYSNNRLVAECIIAHKVNSSKQMSLSNGNRSVNTQMIFLPLSIEKKKHNFRRMFRNETHYFKLDHFVYRLQFH